MEVILVLHVRILHVLHCFFSLVNNISTILDFTEPLPRSLDFPSVTSIMSIFRRKGFRTVNCLRTPFLFAYFFHSIEDNISIHIPLLCSTHERVMLTEL